MLMTMEDQSEGHAAHPATARLPRHVRDQVEDELFRYRDTLRDIRTRRDLYTSLSGEGDDLDLAINRARLAASDPTGHSAARMADDRELRRWEYIVRAIDMTRDAMPGRMADAMTLIFQSREAGKRRRSSWLAAELCLDLTDFYRLRGCMIERTAATMERLAREMRLRPGWPDCLESP